MKSPLRIKLFLLGLSVLLFQGVAYSQPGDPAGEPVPITGIEILIGAGALIGARKFARSRKKGQQ